MSLNLVKPVQICDTHCWRLKDMSETVKILFQFSFCFTVFGQHRSRPAQRYRGGEARHPEVEVQSAAEKIWRQQNPESRTDHLRWRGRHSGTAIPRLTTPSYHGASIKQLLLTLTTFVPHSNTAHLRRKNSLLHIATLLKRQNCHYRKYFFLLKWNGSIFWRFIQLFHSTNLLPIILLLK